MAKKSSVADTGVNTLSFRVVNITNHVRPPGHFLDSGKENGDRLIGVGKSITIQAQSADHLPEYVRSWLDKGYVRVYKSDGTLLESAPPMAGELSPGSVGPIREMSAEVYDNGFYEDEPDLSAAVPAAMPERMAPIIQSTAQSSPSSRVRVSLGSENEGVPAGEISPIPGDRPRSVDDSDKFSVKAQRGAHLGKQGNRG